MKLVLLKDVKHLGKVGQEVEVKAGFARNYLLPTKSALTPTEENLKVISEMKDELMKKEQEVKDAALAIKEKLSGYTQNFKLEVKEDSDELLVLYPCRMLLIKLKVMALILKRGRLTYQWARLKS